MRQVSRRTILLAAAVGLAAPLAALAQQPSKVYRVGFLVPGSRPQATNPDEGWNSFVQSMQAIGYVVGRNLVIEWRFADENYERLPALASELARLKVDVIVTHTSFGLRAAREATTAIPIVFVGVTDPVGRGFVSSLARPGGNVTGIANFAATVVPKQLELLREIMPRISRVGLLGPGTSYAMDSYQGAAQKLGIQLNPVAVSYREDIPQAFDTLAKGRAEALILRPATLFNVHYKLIADLAIKARLPLVSGTTETTEAGGLLSYADEGPGLEKVALLVDKILKGAKPGDLPIEQSAKFVLAINLKTARTLGLTVPQSILLRADRVIE